MKHPKSKLLGASFLFLGYLALSGAIVSLFSGGTCVACSGCGCDGYDDDDDNDGGGDDDDDCYKDDDDDDGLADETSIERSSLDLRMFDLAPSEEPGAHPVRRLAGDGPALAAVYRRCECGKDELAAFTALVREANAELLALPPESGTLILREARFVDTGAFVAWAQVPPGGRSLEDAIDGAGQTFLFDVRGHLVAVDNATWLEPAEALVER